MIHGWDDGSEIGSRTREKERGVFKNLKGRHRLEEIGFESMFPIVHSRSLDGRTANMYGKVVGKVRHARLSWQCNQFISLSVIFSQILNTHLQHVPQLDRNLPFLCVQLKLAQLQRSVPADLVDCYSVFNGEYQHVEGRIPSGCDIVRHHSARQLKLVKRLKPRWEHNCG